MENVARLEEAVGGGGWAGPLGRAGAGGGRGGARGRRGGSWRVESGRAAGMGRAGAMGTSRLSPKSCKHFRVKYARGEIFGGKDWGVLGKDWGGLGKECILWGGKTQIFVGKENRIISMEPPMAYKLWSHQLHSNCGCHFNFTNRVSN